MPRYAIALEFDGTAYVGTQRQAVGRTLQAEAEAALTRLTGDPVRVRFASRLDAGVSATFLPCDVCLVRDWSPETLGAAMAARLPADAGVLAVARVADDFDARRDARAKTYVYRIVVRTTRPALEPHAWWLGRLAHPACLSQLAEKLPGHRDLSGFACLRHDSSDADDPFRTVHAASWTILPHPWGMELLFRISGSGFLYRQVRFLVGGMIQVARGSSSVPDFLATVAGGRQAPRVGDVAPPQGLRLESVGYEPEPDWVWL